MEINAIRNGYTVYCCYKKAYKEFFYHLTISLSHDEKAPQENVLTSM